MKSIKASLFGMLIGAVLGMLVTLIAGVIWSELSSQPAGTSQMLLIIKALTPFSVFNGAMIGGLAAVCRMFRINEVCLLGVLVSVAAASVVVMRGGFANGSLLPIALYGIALVNGLLVTLVIRSMAGQDYPGTQYEAWG